LAELAGFAGKSDIASVTFESASHAGDAIVELGSLHLAVAVGH
jgi:hypothetical protein